jgi:hypothetical protein
MSGLFGHLRSTAGKAAFEAEKVRRVAGLQSTIRSLKADTNRVYYEAGQLVFGLYEAGEIEQPALEAICGRILALRSEIAAREQEIEQIRREPYLEATLDASGRAEVCPNGHGPLISGARFCQVCGAVGVLPGSVSTSTCARCGAALQEGARFCLNCGHAVTPEPAGATTGRCRNCGAELIPKAQFCADCGAGVNASVGDEAAGAPEDLDSDASMRGD